MKWHSVCESLTDYINKMVPLTYICLPLKATAIMASEIAEICSQYCIHTGVFHFPSDSRIWIP